MNQLFKKIWRFVFGESLYRIRKVDDFPDILQERTIYLIDDWAIGLKCPCGCQTDIQLNSLPNASPRWSYKIGADKKMSIYPSIRRIKGCKSHFWLVKGLVKWCPDSGTYF